MRGEEAATLVIELENPQAEIPEALFVRLWRTDQDYYPPDRRLVEVAEGQLRVEGILPGNYRIRVRAGGDEDYAARLLLALLTFLGVTREPLWVFRLHSGAPRSGVGSSGVQ